MDRLLIVFFSLLISSTCLHAQVEHVFSKDFDHNGQNNSSSNVEEVAPGQYVFSQWRDTPNYRDLELIKINEEGDSITSTRVQYNNQQLYDGGTESLIHLSDSRLAYLYCPDNDSIAILSFFDTSLNLLDTHIYNLGFPTATNTIKQVNDSTIILAGRIGHSNGDLDIFTVNINLQGTARWKKIITDPDRRERNPTISYSNDKILIGCISEFTPSDLRPKLVVLSANGTVEFDTIYEDYATDIDFVEDKSDDNIYILVAESESNLLATLNPVLAKVSKDNYQFIWSKSYLVDSGQLPYDGVARDNVISFIGSTIIPTTQDSTFLIQVSKTNGDLFNTKWYKYNNALLDIDAASDGGFIIAGHIPNPSLNAWIVKADPNGCISQLCLGVDDVVKQNVNVSIYPNPTRQNSTLAIEKAHLLGKGAVFTLYNSTGQEIMHFPVQGSDFQKRLRVDEPGLYFGVLTQNGEPIKTAKWIVY